jgi:hypothetical protein
MDDSLLWSEFNRTETRIDFATAMYTLGFTLLVGAFIPRRGNRGLRGLTRGTAIKWELYIKMGGTFTPEVIDKEGDWGSSRFGLWAIKAGILDDQAITTLLSRHFLSVVELEAIIATNSKIEILSMARKYFVKKVRKNLCELVYDHDDYYLDIIRELISGDRIEILFDKRGFLYNWVNATARKKLDKEIKRYIFNMKFSELLNGEGLTEDIRRMI